MAKRTFNIILIGKTGCGKSSTGNFILRKQTFEAKGGFTSTTKNITSEETTQDGRRIKVVDTPGLFDTEENVFETALKIQTSLNHVSPGPHAFLIVIDASHKYTDEEKKTQHIIQLTFGEKIFNHALIIFTHEDQFKSSDELLSEARKVPELQDLVKLCGSRCITLNTVTEDIIYRREKLMKIINEVSRISENGIMRYTDDISIFTEILKEQAVKKAGVKVLTLEFVNSVLQKQRDFYEQQNKIKSDEAYKNGQASGYANGLAQGAIGGAVGGVGILAITGAGLLASAISNNPEKVKKFVMAGVDIGVKIYEMKCEQDAQRVPMHSDTSESIRYRQNQEIKALEGFLSSMKR